MNKLLAAPSADEMAAFIAKLREEEVHLLGCGGGPVTDWANSIGWLRFRHGKRQLLRLAVYLSLSSEPQEPQAEGVPTRSVNDIFYRYEDRRLLRDLRELRDEWANPLTAPADSNEHARELSRLEELIAQINNRLR